VSGSVALVYDDSFLAYRHADWHPLQPRRVKLAVEEMGRSGLLDQAELVTPRLATDAELALVHDLDYVELVRKLGHGADLGRAELVDVVRSGFAHPDNPVFENMHEASALIAGGSLQAAELVHSGRARHAFNPAGGLHHAMRHQSSGFCVYNDVAVAAAWLREQGHRVAVVDVDVHHGDGTQAAFEEQPDVLTLSLHGKYFMPEVGHDFFPGSGGSEEAGSALVNVPFPRYTWDEPWLKAFDAVVPERVRRFHPTVLLTQDGCDTHLLDPLADLRCSTRIWPPVGRRFHDLADELCEGRWVALGGGGYAVEEVVPRAWTLLFAEMTGQPQRAQHLLDPESYPPPAELQERIWPAVDLAIAAAIAPPG